MPYLCGGMMLYLCGGNRLEWHYTCVVEWYYTCVVKWCYTFVVEWGHTCVVEIDWNDTIPVWWNEAIPVWWNVSIPVWWNDTIPVWWNDTIPVWWAEKWSRMCSSGTSAPVHLSRSSLSRCHPVAWLCGPVTHNTLYACHTQHTLCLSHTTHSMPVTHNTFRVSAHSVALAFHGAIQSHDFVALSHTTQGLCTCLLPHYTTHSVPVTHNTLCACTHTTHCAFHTQTLPVTHNTLQGLCTQCLLLPHYIRLCTHICEAVRTHIYSHSVPVSRNTTQGLLHANAALASLYESIHHTLSVAVNLFHLNLSSLHIWQCSPYFTHCYCFTSPICEAVLSVLHTLLLLHFTNLWSSALRTSHTAIASLHQSVKQCSPYFTHCYCFTSPICEAVLSVLHTLLLLHFTNLWSSAIRTSHTTIASLHQSVKQCSPYFTHCYCFTSPICEAVLSVLHTLLLLHFTNLWSSALRTSHTAIASLHQSVKQCSPYFTHCYCFTSPVCEEVLPVLHTLLLLHFTNLWSSQMLHYAVQLHCFTGPCTTEYVQDLHVMQH